MATHKMTPQLANLSPDSKSSILGFSIGVSFAKMVKIEKRKIKYMTKLKQLSIL